MMNSNPMTHPIRQRFGTRVSHAFAPLWRSAERWPVLGTVVMLALSWFIVVRTFPPGQESVITHYSIPFGIDGIGSWWVMWLVPAIATCLMLVHVLLLLPFARKHAERSVFLIHAATFIMTCGLTWGMFLLRYQQA